MATKYMHTLNGQPALYRPGEQIYFATHQKITLATSLKQIRREQGLSKAWRNKRQFLTPFTYGHKLIQVDGK